MVGKSRTEENPENKSESNSTVTYIINEYKRCKLASKIVTLLFKIVTLVSKISTKVFNIILQHLQLTTRQKQTKLFQKVVCLA